MSVIHAEHIGSFVRPKTLLDAIRAHRAGTLDAQALAKVVDDSIRDIVAFQESIWPADHHRRRVSQAKLVGGLHRRD